MNKKENHVILVGFALVASAIVIILGAILELKKSMRMQVYAISHDCTWIYVGANNSDDGYICK